MDDERLLCELSRKIDELSIRIEKLNLAEYLEVLRNPKRLLYINFLAGVARGFGTAMGFTFLGAFILYVLQRIVILKLPVIGDFIAELVRIVQNELSVK
ncbi:DUF5665 domain-containing protein [Thermosediminibacter oceani]|uniref:Uncharacterized protein n=1 Tax=Thermosediminibacter oceani (strain ATCC BAA-1034 / DSM 16646 / JW/IW-1228P) TaxID=555079 RepID=D9S2Z7_THEOJ|nr:DUF5665 domain-containing protein [Thermosediminibacter oceani]ADL07774.1 conserved hypothetical protein [Thermosediminibacter oceani DSM 16646]